MVYAFLVPVLGGALAVVALHEPVHPEQVVGALLVVAGLVLTRITWPRLRRERSAAPAKDALVSLD